MDKSLKAQLTGWSATVGLTALALLGGGKPADASTVPVATTQNADNSAQDVAQTTGSYQVADWWSSPPPPPPPPAVGAVRG